MNKLQNRALGEWIYWKDNRGYVDTDQKFYQINVCVSLIVSPMF